MKSNKNLSKLKFKVISISSIDDNEINPLQNLSNLMQTDGYEWISERFCQYPQVIVIKFEYPVHLQQINVLCNDKKIAKNLIFHSFCPKMEDYKAYKYSDVTFNYIGFVDLKDNKACNYQVRECKKVFININTLYLKILLDNNYTNMYNKFQQVGIIHIKCYGYALPNKINSIKDKDKEKEQLANLNANVEKIIRDIIGNKYDIIYNKILNIDKKENNEKYLEIKGKVEEMNNFGKKIYQYKLLEKKASNKDDFDNAIQYKNKCERLKNKVYEIAKELTYNLNGNSLMEIINNSNDNVTNEINNAINISQNITSKNNISFENDNKKKILNSLSELDILKDVNDHDDTVLPAVNKKKQRNKNGTVENEEEEDSQQYIQKLDPLEEMNEDKINDYKLLIKYIREDGLRHLLSNQFGYKVKGFEVLSNQLNSIFSDENLLKIIIELINLESLFLDDKNNSAIIKSYQIIEKTMNKISNSDIKSNKKLLKLIKERIIDKIQAKLGNGESKIREGALQLYLHILNKNILNYNSMIHNLLSNDVDNNLLNSSLNSTPNLTILSKLIIIKKILEDYDNIIKNNYSTEESFPKDLILDYIFMNIKNNKLEIKKILREVIDLAAQIFGPQKLREKIYFYIDDDKEILKLISQIDSLKPILNSDLNKSNSQTNINKSKQTKNTLKKNASMKNMKNSNSKTKINDKSSKKRNASTKKGNSKTNIKSKKSNKSENDEDDNNDENKCDLCFKDLGNISINNHIKKCLMYTECESCKKIVIVEELNSHKLNECKNKKKFNECPKCKEAIQDNLFDSHTKKNTCNIAKEDMSRCPLCHHDIEKSDKGFYQHLVLDGCAYQKRKAI